MSPSDFKAYADQVIRLTLAIGALCLAFYAMYLSFQIQDKTIFTSLATASGVSALGVVLNFFFGNSHKSPLPPDTTTFTETKTPEGSK